MNRRAKVFNFNKFAGILEELDEGGFSFTYSAQYLSDPDAKAISLTMPLQEQAFASNQIFPFFDGLIPEGWLLDIAVKNWKLDPKDRMGLLLHVCRDCIGSVHIETNNAK
ncbi:MAG TPA: HipA N-terminal domain-containing protein [Gammaproteobacteria bacterium]|nr:HipA N-terminal domain-containing protein [Gammaproteobacteria bacterium]